MGFKYNAVLNFYIDEVFGGAPSCGTDSLTVFFTAIVVFTSGVKTGVSFSMVFTSYTKTKQDRKCVSLISKFVNLVVI